MLKADRQQIKTNQMTNEEKVRLIYEDQIDGTATDMTTQLDELVDNFGLGIEDTEDDESEEEIPES